jgi:hypothetical protein
MTGSLVGSPRLQERVAYANGLCYVTQEHGVAPLCVKFLVGSCSPMSLCTSAHNVNVGYALPHAHRLLSQEHHWPAILTILAILACRRLWRHELQGLLAALPDEARAQASALVDTYAPGPWLDRRRGTGGGLYVLWFPGGGCNCARRSRRRAAARRMPTIDRTDSVDSYASRHVDQGRKDRVCAQGWLAQWLCCCMYCIMRRPIVCAQGTGFRTRCSSESAGGAPGLATTRPTARTRRRYVVPPAPPRAPPPTPCCLRAPRMHGPHRV